MANNTAHCWGAGHICIDAVHTPEGDFAAIGGSCGNVLSILSWLGWQATPLVRVGGGPLGEWVDAELRSLHVDAGYVYPESRHKTPVTAQTFGPGKGGKRDHRFSFRCLHCQTPLPKHRPISRPQAEHFAFGAMPPNAYYFDRASAAAIHLAKEARRENALVVFEPTAIPDLDLCARAAKQADILKYSHEQTGPLWKNLPPSSLPPLIVETRGNAGLAYRLNGRWTNRGAFSIPRLVDSAGAGDWCAALLIHSLRACNAADIRRLPKSAVAQALYDGQHAAAINCGFYGARGAMHEYSLRQWFDAMRPHALPLLTMKKPAAPRRPLMAYCTRCGEGK